MYNYGIWFLGIRTEKAETQHGTWDLSSSYFQNRRRSTRDGNRSGPHSEAIHGSVKRTQTNDKSVDTKRQRSAPKGQRYTE